MTAQEFSQKNAWKYSGSSPWFFKCFTWYGKVEFPLLFAFTWAQMMFGKWLDCSVEDLPHEAAGTRSCHFGLSDFFFLISTSFHFQPSLYFIWWVYHCLFLAVAASPTFSVLVLHAGALLLLVSGLHLALWCEEEGEWQPLGKMKHKHDPSLTLRRVFSKVV